MASKNKVILVGNLGQDPEVRYTGLGVAVCNLRVATNERWTNGRGERQERTEWHNVVVFGKAAESCGEYLTKGRQVMLEGRLRTRDWEDRDGNKRRTTEIHTRQIDFLGTYKKSAESDSYQQNTEDKIPTTNEEDISVEVNTAAQQVFGG